MIGPDGRATDAVEEQVTPGAGDPVASLQDDLRAHLQACRQKLLDRVHTDLWEPLRRSADRLGALRDEAREAEDPLRDAGRAVRMLCDELEQRDPSDTLRGAVGHHLGEVAEFGHTVPRMMDLGGDRVVPARGAARTVLEAQYPGAIRGRLDPDTVVLDPGRALPPSPADLLRPEDHGGRLTGALDRAERHFRLALEGAAEEAVEETGVLLRRHGALDRLRLRWRRSRTPARRRSVESALGQALDRAGEELSELLEARRFTADLARRERALDEAAAEAAERLEAAAGRAGEMRSLAGRIEDAGRSVADGREGDAGPGSGPDPRKLERLEAGVREALDRVRAGLPETDRPEGELNRALGRFVQLSEALAGLGSGEGDTRIPAARRPAALRDRVARAVPRVREAVREAGEIVSHGLRAARSESTVREPDPAAVTGLVRGSCERSARRLRDATDLLEEALDGVAVEVREVPDRILAELRERGHPADREGPAAGWRQEAAKAAGWAARAARRFRAWWRERIGSPGSGRAAGPRGAPTLEAGGHGDDAPTDPGPAEAGEFEELPAIYRWLFRLEPLDDPHLLVGRGREVDRLRSLRRRWERAEPAALAVVGRPGIGKTSLLNCGAAELEAGVPVHRGRIDRRIVDAEEAVGWFARFFGVEGDVRSAVELAEALGDRRELVLLENAERLFRREVGGYRAIRALGKLVEATERRIAWVVTFDREPWRVVSAVTGIEGRFDDTLSLGRLDRRELEEAVLARHRLTGYDLRFAGTGDPDARRRAWFDRLYERTGGHPGRSLQVWRESLVATGPHEIRALPPRSPRPGRLRRLDRETLFVLAALIQHGDLPQGDLPRLLHAPAEQTDERFALLRRRGLVCRVPGLPPSAPWHVERSAYAAVEDRLRSAGLLVPDREGDA